MSSPIEPTLVDLFEPYADLELTKGNQQVYREFRSLEPSLVSCLDESEEKKLEPDVLVLEENGKPLGMISLVIQKNKYKKGAANKYARIDLVIVRENCRKLGIGRLLLLCGITYLLGTYGNRLYSISCLAAHKAVETVLMDLLFIGHYEDAKYFWQGELKIDEKDLKTLTGKFVENARQALNITNFRLRQRRGDR